MNEYWVGESSFAVANHDPVDKGHAENVSAPNIGTVVTCVGIDTIPVIPVEEMFIPENVRISIQHHISAPMLDNLLVGTFGLHSKEDVVRMKYSTLTDHFAKLSLGLIPNKSIVQALTSLSYRRVSHACC